MKIKNIYELSKYDYKKLYLKEWEELSLFDWDPDYIIDSYWYPCYFCISWNTIYTSDYDDPEIDDMILDFVEWKNRKSFEEQNREAFRKYDWIKLAYRWWIWYVYSLYYYTK